MNPLTDFPTIFMGCPINPGREYITQTYLDHLHQLDYPRDKVTVAFLLNHPEGQDATKLRDILMAFRDKVGGQYHQVLIEEVVGDYDYTNDLGGRTQGRRFGYFAAIRNRWIQMRGGEDYIYSVDSDILVPKHSLRQLLSHDKDIVSLIIENGPMMDPELHPSRLGYWNVPYNWWLYHRKWNWWNRVGCHTRTAFNVMMRTGVPNNHKAQGVYDYLEYVHVDPSVLYGLMWQQYDPEIYKGNLKCDINQGPFMVPTVVGELPEVDMTGAAYLISRRVFDAGVRYRFHHQGEDPGFCADAQSKGFKIYCDFFLHADHVMTPQIYEQREQFLRGYKGVRVIRRGVPRLRPEPQTEVVLKEANV